MFNNRRRLTYDLNFARAQQNSPVTDPLYGGEIVRDQNDSFPDPSQLFHPLEASCLKGDITNRQDWGICESVQRGMHSRVHQHGYYAPMEDYSLDIRRYVRERLGPDLCTR